jgi:hypothetical protein
VLFQGDAYRDMAADHKLEIKTPMKLAGKFGASIYASCREYARTHRRACAVYVLEPITYCAQTGARAVVERETIAKLNEPFTDLSKAGEPDRERLTREAMARGNTLIYGGRISADDLLGAPDLLRKEPGGYVPGDIKSGRGEEAGGDESDGKPKVHYAVQLALYVDILEHLKLSAGRRAFVWDIHGEALSR